MALEVLRAVLLLELELDGRRVRGRIALLGATELEARRVEGRNDLAAENLAEPELGVLLGELDHVLIECGESIVERLDLAGVLVATEGEVDGELGRTRASVLTLGGVLDTIRNLEARRLENEVTGLAVPHVGHLAAGLKRLGLADGDLRSVESGRLNDRRRHDNDWTYGWRARAASTFLPASGRLLRHAESV